MRYSSTDSLAHICAFVVVMIHNPMVRLKYVTIVSQWESQIPSLVSNPSLHLWEFKLMSSIICVSENQRPTEHFLCPQVGWKTSLTKRTMLYSMCSYYLNTTCGHSLKVRCSLWVISPLLSMSLPLFFYVCGQGAVSLSVYKRSSVAHLYPPSLFCCELLMLSSHSYFIPTGPEKLDPE